MKTCTTCGETKPEDAFVKRAAYVPYRNLGQPKPKSVPSTWCKTCHEIYNKGRKYGLTRDEYLAMVAAQDGKCAICGRSPDPGKPNALASLHVDHCHETGKNRGLLCNNCNLGLGHFKHDAELLRRAAEYL